MRTENGADLTLPFPETITFWPGFELDYELYRRGLEFVFEGAELVDADEEEAA